VKVAEFFKYFLASVNWSTVIVLSLIIIPVTDTLFRMIASKVRSGLRAEREDHQDLRLKYCCLEDQMRELRLENLALSQISTDLQNLPDLGNRSTPRERPHPLTGKKALAKPEMTDIDDEVIDIIVVRDLFDDRGENGMDAIQEQPEERQKEVIDLISVRDLFNGDNEVVALPDQYETEISIGESADLLTARDEPEVNITADFNLTGEFEVVMEDEVAELPASPDETVGDTVRELKAIRESDVIECDEVAELPASPDEAVGDTVRELKVIRESDVVECDAITDLPTSEGESELDTARAFKLRRESDVNKGDEITDPASSRGESELDIPREFKTLRENDVAKFDEVAGLPPFEDEPEADTTQVFNLICASDVIDEAADGQTDSNDVAKGDTIELCPVADADIPEIEDASRHVDDADASMEQVTEQVIEPVSASTEEAVETPERSGVSDQRNGEMDRRNSIQELPDDEVGLIKLTDEERAILIAISKQRLDGVSSSGIISSQRVQLAVNRLKDDGLIDEIDDEIVDSAAGQRWLDSRDSH
jgi:hypothetical protein